jgi:protein-tyrosine phosphatase
VKLWLPFAILGLLCLGGCLVFDKVLQKVCAFYLAANFFLLSAACLFRWPGMWLKRGDGCLSPLSRAFLFPLHALNAASFFVAMRIQNESPADRIAPNVWLGRRMNSFEARRQFGTQALAVLDMTSEFSECSHFAGMRYLCLPTVDHTAPTQAQLRAGVGFILANSHERTVFVHCALGHGRSATVVAAWLLKNNAALTVEEAIKQLKAIRPDVRLKPEQQEALEVFVGELRSAK